MLTALANRGISAPKRVLGAAGVILVIAVIFGAPVASHLGSGGFDNPSSASTKAKDLLSTRFHTGYPNLVLELTSTAGANAAATKQVGLAAVSALQRDQYVDNVSSYWTASPTVARGLVSKDGTSALVVARVIGNDTQAPDRAAAAVKELTGTRDGVTVKAGGIDTVYSEV
ncbi:MAG TPA: MMPL family transporter, partial [Mycobacteriales bacterium]|nr:MMPL family transporter [Mycobacteriales bacterium]